MSGLLGKAALENGTSKIIYTVPAGKVATCNLSLCNFTELPRKVYVAVHDTTPHSNADRLEYGTLIPPHGVLERTGLVLSAGENLRAWDDGTGVSARVHGFEEDA